MRGSSSFQSDLGTIFITLEEINRRIFLANAAKAFLGLGTLPIVSATGKPTLPNLKAAPARNIIYLYMAGGMSHIDTFDPKPEAGAHIKGPVGVLPTSGSNQISSYFPNLSKHMHQGVVINSMWSNQGAHEQGNYFMHTSYLKRGTITHPTLAAWSSFLLPKINQSLTSAVSINPPSNFNPCGFLENVHSPLPIGKPSDGLKNSKLPPNITKQRFNKKLSIVEQMNQEFLARYNSKDVRAYGDLFKEALKLMSSSDLNAFDINRESPATKKLYGDGPFGQACLLARRLIEYDMRFVEVTLGGWDTHDDNFERLEDLTRSLDQGLSALLFDLERHGLLENTLVVLSTEFGRSPEIVSGREGRNHWAKSFSTALFGAGLKGGSSYGKTDAEGKEIIENKVLIPDFNATIAHAIGLSLDKTVFSPSGRPFHVAAKGKPLLHLFS